MLASSDLLTSVYLYTPINSDFSNFLFIVFGFEGCLGVLRLLKNKSISLLGFLLVTLLDNYVRLVAMQFDELSLRWLPYVGFCFGVSTLWFTYEPKDPNIVVVAGTVIFLSFIEELGTISSINRFKLFSFSGHQL